MRGIEIVGTLDSATGAVRFTAETGRCGYCGKRVEARPGRRERFEIVKGRRRYLVHDHCRAAFGGN
jgi:hypothetical protein